jgi:hypothetical protein
MIGRVYQRARQWTIVRPWRELVASIGLTCLLVTLAVGAVIDPRLARVRSIVVLILVAVVFRALVSRFLGVVVGLAAVGVAFVPIYWSPGRIQGSAITGTTLFVAPVIIGALLVRRRQVWTKSWLDLVVLLYLAWTVTATNIDDGTHISNYFAPLLTIAVPYLMGRILFTQQEAPILAFTRALVSAGVALSGFALIEYETRTNAFEVFIAPRYLANVWAVPHLRGGHLRADASFGQPLVFSVFLSVCFVLLAALPVRRRWIKLVGLAALLVGMYVTLGRVCYGLALFGTVLVLIKRRGIFAGWLLSIGVPLGATLFSGTISSFVQGGDDAVSQNSAEYHTSLISALAEPALYSLSGTPGGGETLGSQLSNYNGSIDSEWIYELLQFGWPAPALLLIVGLVTFRALLQANSNLQVAWAAATLTYFLSFFFVASLLQNVTYFWIGTAIIAGIGQHVPSEGGVAGPGAVKVATFAPMRGESRVLS